MGKELKKSSGDSCERNLYGIGGMKLHRLISRLVDKDSSAVFKGMITLALGSGSARLMGIAAMPLLSRLYSPEDFGVLAVFSSTILIIAPLVSLRYALALPLPRQDGTAINLLALCFGFIFLGVLLVGFMLGIFKVPFLEALSMEVLIPWWWMVVLGVFVTALYELMTLWATRRRNYRIIARTNVWQGVCECFVKIAFGLFSITPLGLLLGDLASKGGGLIRIAKEFSEELRKLPSMVSVGRLKKVAYAYRGFPYYRVPSQFLMVFSQQSPLLFSAAIYGAGITGQLSLALMALAVPVNLIGGNMGKALYAEAAAIGNSAPEKIYKMTKNVQIKLVAIAVPAGLFLFLTGEFLFENVFGEEWRRAGIFASALSPYIVFQFASAPLVQLMNILSNQLAFLVINCIRAFFLVASFCMAWAWDLSSMTFVYGYSFIMSVFYLGVSLFVIISIRRKVL